MGSSTRHSIRLMIADDHRLVVDGLCSMLQGEFEIVATARNGDELLEELTHSSADCLLLDLSMPERNGLELLPHIRTIAPSLRVLVVSMHVDRVLVEKALSEGADGFVPKDATRSELAQAIRDVAAGKRHVSWRLPTYSSRSGLSAPHPALEGLTQRQLTVLTLIADGKTTAEIAKVLTLSTTTVGFHRAGIRRRLGIQSEAGLIQYAALLKAAMAEHGR